MRTHHGVSLPGIERPIDPPAPTTLLEGGLAEIRPEPCGNVQLFIKGQASGSYPDEAAARRGLAVFQRMGLVS